VIRTPEELKTFEQLVLENARARVRGEIPPHLISGVFGADSIIRTDKPERIICGGIDHAAWAALEDELLRLGQKCSSGCKTQDHLSYIECLRDKNTRTYLAAPSRGLDGSAQKRWDAELGRYRAARKEGIQPDGTTMTKVMDAVKRSDEAGAAYGRDFSKATPFEES